MHARVCTQMQWYDPPSPTLCICTHGSHYMSFISIEVQTLSRKQNARPTSLSNQDWYSQDSCGEILKSRPNNLTLFLANTDVIWCDTGYSHNHAPIQSIFAMFAFDPFSPGFVRTNMQRSEGMVSHNAKSSAVKQFELPRLLLRTSNQEHCQLMV